jgi:hypothetical protein
MIIKNEMTISQFVESVHNPSRFLHLSGRPCSNNWAGTGTYEEALGLLENGWPEGLNQIAFHNYKVRPVQPSESLDFTAHFDVCGDSVDVGRYLSGEPECMIDHRMKIVPKQGRVIKMLVNVAASSMIDRDSMFRRGAVALRILDALEGSGYRCEVTCGSVFRGATSYHASTVVKEADQPLDLDRMAFFLAHPSIERRLFFRIFEQNELALKMPDHGQPGEFPADPGTVYIPSLDSLYLRTPEQADALINSTLAKYLEPEAQVA